MAKAWRSTCGESEDGGTPASAASFLSMTATVARAIGFAGFWAGNSQRLVFGSRTASQASMARKAGTKVALGVSAVFCILNHRTDFLGLLERGA